jgi:hypothetical protein
MNKLPLLLLTGLLAGCQATTFERPPLQAIACDPALAGQWSSQGEDGDADGEMVLKIGKDCALEVTENKPDGPVTGEATTFQLGRQGKHSYAWVDANWLMRRFDEDHRPPAGDVYLMRYQLRGDTQLWSTDDPPIAHAIIDDKLEGEVIARDERLFNRLTGEQDPAVLDRKGFFDADSGRFKRVREP